VGSEWRPHVQIERGGGLAQRQAAQLRPGRDGGAMVGNRVDRGGRREADRWAMAIVAGGMATDTWGPRSV
jgi:hypothetical protein